MAILRDQLSGLGALNATSLAVTWSVNPAPGAKVLLAILTGSTAPTSVVDNGTVPRTFIQDVTDTTRANKVFIFRGDNITVPASGSYTVTISMPSSQNITSGGISYTGVATGGPTASSVNDAANSGPVSTGNATPARAGALGFAAFADLLASGTDSIALTNASFTSQFTETNATSFITGAVADWINTGGGPTAENCTWTISASVTQWAGLIAVYDAIPDPFVRPLTPPGRQSPSSWALLTPGWAGLAGSNTGSSGAANVTGVGALVPVAAGAGTPSGSADTAGVGAAVSVTAGAGTPSGSANVTGVSGQISVAGGVGSPSAGDVVTGVGAQVAITAGTGSPAGSANVTGVGAAVTVAGGVGTPSGSGNLTATGAQVTVAGGVGAASGGANVAGVAAAVPVVAGAGTPSGSGKATGVAASVGVAAGLGIPSGSASVTGAGAQAAIAGGSGTLSGGANVTGAGAQVSVGAGTGTPAAGGSRNVAGVAAQVSAAGGIGSVSASASIQGVAALVQLAAGTGTPAGAISVQGVAAIVTAAAGTGVPVGGTVILLDAKCVMAFRALAAVTQQATVSYSAGQPSQAGLVTLASDPWTSTYPDTL